MRKIITSLAVLLTMAVTAKAQTQPINVVCANRTQNIVKYQTNTLENKNICNSSVESAPVDTIDVTMDNAEVNYAADGTFAMGIFAFVGADQNNEYSMQLVVNSRRIAGTYTQDDVNAALSFLSHNGTKIKIAEVSDFTVTGSVWTCSTYIEILGNDSILYRINFSYTMPAIVPTDTIDVTMDNFEVAYVNDNTFKEGMFQLFGADQNNEYGMYLSAYSDNLEGSYTLDDMSWECTAITHDGITFPVNRVSNFTVTGDEIRACSTYVEVVADDSILYRINYSFVRPVIVPTDTIDIVMDNAEFNNVIDMTKTKGFFLFDGKDQNNEYELRIGIYSDQIAGTYTEDDMFFSPSHLMKAGQFVMINKYDGFTFTGDEYACTAYLEIISRDSVLYRITYSYSYGIKDTVDIVMDSENNLFYNHPADFFLYGEDQTREYLMSLLVESDHLAGTYGMSDIYRVLLTHISGTDTTDITLTKASEFTVRGDSTWCRTNLVLISEDSVMYRIAFEYGEEPVGVENTVEEPEFVVVSENNTIVVYTAAGENVMVCDMAGRILMNSKSTSDIERIDVAVPGIYVVRVAGKAAKVLVK